MGAASVRMGQDEFCVTQGGLCVGQDGVKEDQNGCVLFIRMVSELARMDAERTRLSQSG